MMAIAAIKIIEPGLLRFRIPDTVKTVELE